MSQLTHKDYELKQRDVLYQGVYCLVKLHLKHRLYNGEWSDVFTREILERPNAAAVLPYDPILDRVILIEQFRAGAIQDPRGPWQIEIPAGVKDKNEAPEEIARREIVEEAGCEVQELELISDYFESPGGTNEYIYVFCGKVDARNVNGIHGLEDEHENIRVLNLTFEEAWAKLENHDIKNAPAIVALLWLKVHRERLRQKWSR